MRKVLVILFLFCLLPISLDAQVMRAEELENYAKEKYGDKWTEAAENLGKELSLDKNNSLSYSQVIEAEGKTKDELYVALNYWFTATFNDANSVIKLNDKEVGSIIAEGLVSNIASHAGGLSSYDVSIRPIIKVDIREGRIRVTYIIQYYDISKGTGIIAAMGGGHTKLGNEKWTLEECFPFTEKDKHKKASSKALVMAHAYSNVIMDKIEEAVKNGLVGNEDEDW